jgi:hypothetical protein
VETTFTVPIGFKTMWLLVVTAKIILSWSTSTCKNHFVRTSESIDMKAGSSTFHFNHPQSHNTSIPTASPCSLHRDPRGAVALFAYWKRRCHLDACLPRHVRHMLSCLDRWCRGLRTCGSADCMRPRCTGCRRFVPRCCMFFVSFCSSIHSMHF